MKNHCVHFQASCELTMCEAKKGHGFAVARTRVWPGKPSSENTDSKNHQRHCAAVLCVAHATATGTRKPEKSFSVSSEKRENSKLSMLDFALYQPNNAKT